MAQVRGELDFDSFDRHSVCWYIGSKLIKGIVESVWIYTTRLYPSARDSIVSTGSEFTDDKGTGDQISENVKMVKIVQNRPHVERFLFELVWSTGLIGKVIKICKQVNMTMWAHIVSGENTGLFASLLGMVQNRVHVKLMHEDLMQMCGRELHTGVFCARISFHQVSINFKIIVVLVASTMIGFNRWESCESQTTPTEINEIKMIKRCYNVPLTKGINPSNGTM